MVTISRPIAMMTHEVRVSDFRRFVEATGYLTDEQTRERSVFAYDQAGRYWDNQIYEIEEEQPVACVSWNDAQAYRRWLSEQTGKAYRLPSEAEWEYAARAGSETKYHFGDSADQLCLYGNVADNTWLTKGHSPLGEIVACSDGSISPTRVKQYKANAFGLYDMYGGVWEWVEDCYNDSYHGAPSDGSAKTSCDTTDRVMRGGCWATHSGENFRSANRAWGEPSDCDSSVGFRLVQDLDP